MDNTPATGVHATEVARAGYEAYGQWTGWKTHDGHDMLPWIELPEHVQLAWVAAAGGIVRVMFRPTPQDGE
jgi:hypothetical protein